ncbi:hypothetical protein QE367_001158 [Microbacterium paludicola]|uniref:Uncharacterized protein n=2 Tax=Microbacterium paludicola TaxID=300019 RepID=A0ABU1I1V5_9MICO|nr:hypothetical protein [Microbacterium paludicola]
MMRRIIDRLAAAFGGAEPDYVAEIAAGTDDASDVVLAHARCFPAAYTRGGTAGVMSVEGVIGNAALSAAQNTISGARHVAGDAGSIAAGLSRDAALRILALGERRVTWWDFGMSGTHPPAELVQSVARTAVGSITDTGERAQGGAVVVRFTFVDGSTFDYRFIRPSDEFWSVAKTYPAAP